MILNAYSGTKLQIKDEITKLFEKNMSSIDCIFFMIYVSYRRY